jgi:serine/threonine protein phosphatase PrpC
MKLRNVKLFMALLASFFMQGEQSVFASGAIKDSSAVADAIKLKELYVKVKTLPKADKSIALSGNDLRYLKVKSLKKDAQKELSSAQNLLLPVIKSILAEKKAISLGVETSSLYDSSVIAFSFDQKGVMSYVVYGTQDESPEWLMQAVATSVALSQKQGFSRLTKAGIAAGAIAVIARCASYLNNVISSDSIDFSGFFGSKEEEEILQRHAAERARKEEQRALEARDTQASDNWLELPRTVFLLPDTPILGLSDTSQPFIRKTQEKFGYRIVSAYEMGGRRCVSYGRYDSSKQEDRIDFKENENWMGFAVYDGHGSVAVSQELENTFLSFLLSKLSCPFLVQQEINQIYKEFDDIYCRDFHAGSTAVIFLVNKQTRKGYFLNLGDSRAVAMSADGNLVEETIDHSPMCKSTCQNRLTLDQGYGRKKSSEIEPATIHDVSGCEVERIEAAGGKVYFDGTWRVANISSSRNFGDFYGKETFSLSKADTPIGIYPDIYEFDLSVAQCVVLACDGLYECRRSCSSFYEPSCNCDSVKTQDLAQLIRSAEAENYNPAQYLCWKAFSLGSGDNISSIVIDIPALLRSLTAEDPAVARTEGEDPSGAAAVWDDRPHCGADDGEVAEADSAVRLSRRRSEPSAAPLELTPTFRSRFDQLVVDVKSFESDVLRRNRISDVDLFRQLHLEPSAYPVRSFPEQQVFKTTNLFNAAQPFHKIMDGLYLGNNELTLQFKNSGRVDLTQFENVTYLNAETFENEVKPNNENMDKPPTLIICLDKNDALYRSIRGTDAIEFIYLPLDEKEGDDFNNKFISNREVLFARIIDHLSRADGRVLIHCAQGNHRSVAVLHCFLFETLKQLGNQTDLYSINQFIKSKRSLAMGFAELAQKEYKNHGTPCMPSASSMLYQTLLHCCGSVSGARK